MHTCTEVYSRRQVSDLITGQTTHRDVIQEHQSPGGETGSTVSIHPHMLSLFKWNYQFHSTGSAASEREDPRLKAALFEISLTSGRFPLPQTLCSFQNTHHISMEIHSVIKKYYGMFTEKSQSRTWDEILTLSSSLCVSAPRTSSNEIIEGCATTIEYSLCHDSDDGLWKWWSWIIYFLPQAF